ncbi:unnamed protein product [Musa acuminata subsp. malaccensis]|uniref:(wild Malaysian banana) hypothetical protein n=1 Tax=Musa acuminata subsp. malaccensis TaxID=214687 RepID=A0A804IFS7_MUSAM|nr:unnamed protein product [Musa acuminata subsp. malaccensis]
MRNSCTSSAPPPKANLVTHTLHTLYKTISFLPTRPSLRPSRVDPCTMTATNLLLFVSLGSIDHCDTELSLSPGGVYHRHSSYSDTSASSSRYRCSIIVCAYHWI